MTNTPDKSEKMPIATSTRVPTDDLVEEPESDEEPMSEPIATSTRVP